MKVGLKSNNFCSILFNKIFTSDVLCLKISPQNEHFSNVDFRPLPSLVKSKINKNRKTMCTTTMPLVFKFIWLSSFSTFGAFVRQPKSKKNLQRAITRDRKLISKFVCIDLFVLIRLGLQSYKCPENAEMRKELKFQKASRRKKRIRIILNNTIIERSSVWTEDLN